MTPSESELSIGLRYGALCSVATALFALVYGFVRLEGAQYQPLGTRGYGRAQGLRAHRGWAVVAPFVFWLGQRIDSLIPNRQRSATDALLSAAGDPLGLEPREYVVLVGLCGLCGAGLGGAYSLIAERSVAYVPVLALIGLVIPYARVSTVAQQRLKDISRGLPTMVDLLCLSLSAGLDFPAAIEQIVSKSRNREDALRAELRVMLRELQLGKTRRQVLQLFSKRVKVDAVRELVAAVIQAEEEGTPLAKVLAIQANVSRNRRSTRAEELAARTGLQLVIPLGLVFLAILLLIAAPLGLKVMSGLAHG
ncbi:MAG TPA: type II secretion system F family protein [Polyangiaceae bacterium]|nr:type II secretion system F family protein [Polyangiaceae bacterium]